MKVAARHADVWHCWADPSTFAAKNAVLDRHCEAEGRDPGAVARATGAPVAMTRDPVRRTDDPDDGDVVGTPTQVADRLLEFSSAGADEFIVRDTSALPLRSALDLVDSLTEHALPALGG